jgi:mannan endo-1,4-beta-mannosidase
MGAALLVFHPTSSGLREKPGHAPRPYLAVYPPTGTAPLSVRFDASGSTGDPEVTEYAWDFDDGTTGEGGIVNHTFASAGTFHVRLQVGDGFGRRQAMVTPIEIASPAPDRDPPRPSIAMSPQRGQVPLAVTLDASSSTDNRGITSYRWSFDDDTSGEGRVAHHIFSRPGRHAVTLTVADAAGNTSTIIERVVVSPGPRSAPPQAVFHLSGSGSPAPASITVDARASSDDRSIVAYDWDFGDGQRDHGVTAEHRYAHAGTYEIELTVWDDGGQHSRSSTQVVVAEPAPAGDKVLFDDALAEGVADGTWALSALETEVFHTGQKAISVIAGRDQAFRVAFAPGTTRGFDRVEFWIKSDDPNRLNVRGMFASAGGDRLGPSVSMDGLLLAGAGGALDHSWRRGAVSLEALGGDPGQLTGLAWQAPSDDRPVQFYLDDIALLRPVARLPVVSTCSSLPPVRGPVSRTGSELEADGVPFRAIGVNMYYVQQQLAQHLATGDMAPLREVRQAMDAAACSGATVIRLIGFNDGTPAFTDDAVIQTAPGEYRESGLRGLDLALAEARDHHLRVILTLTNNWAAFGGLPRYADWAQVPHEEAATTPVIREWVADYARMLAARTNVFTGGQYRDDPTVMAVELVNELRCHDCEPGADATAFQLALAHEVAQAWPGHLIGDGGEGFDDDSSQYPGLEKSVVVSGEDGTSFHAIAESPDIDLVSYHLYPDDWHLSRAEAEAYIDAHEEIARRAGKVAYMGEFGEQTRDRERASTYDVWLDRLFAGNAGWLALAWQVAYPGRPDNDGFALFPGSSSASFGALARHAHAVSGAGLDGVSLAVFQPPERPVVLTPPPTRAAPLLVTRPLTASKPTAVLANVVKTGPRIASPQ